MDRTHVPMSNRDAAWHALQARLNTPPYPDHLWRGQLVNVSSQLEYLMGMDAEIYRFEQRHEGSMSWAFIDVRLSLHDLWRRAARGYVWAVEEAASWVDSPSGEPPETLPVSPAQDPVPDRRVTGEALERFAARHPRVYARVRELAEERDQLFPSQGQVDLTASRAADSVLLELLLLLRNDGI